MAHEERLEVSSRPSTLNYALPFELLGEIFSHISDDSLDLRFAIFVCRSWHNAVIHHANLWTNIALGYTFLARFRGARLPDGDAFVRLCISRSSPLPLRISVYDSVCLSLYRKSDVVLFEEYFSLVNHIFDAILESQRNFSNILILDLSRKQTECRPRGSDLHLSLIPSTRIYDHSEPRRQGRVL